MGEGEVVNVCIHILPFFMIVYNFINYLIQVMILLNKNFIRLFICYLYFKKHLIQCIHVKYFILE